MNLLERKEDKKNNLEYAVKVFARLYNYDDTTKQQREQYLNYMNEYICRHETNLYKQRPYWDRFNNLVKNNVIKYSEDIKEPVRY